MTRPLSEQVVVITGASSGIGRAAARKFGEKGASVVLAARNEAGLQEAAEEVRRAGGQALAVPTDVSQWDQIERLAQTAVDSFGRIDTWINDAAVAVYATITDTTIEEIEQQIRVNLLGTMYGVKAVLPVFQRQGSGTIINVASIEAWRALPYHAVYSATKHAVKGFTEGLRMELKHAESGIDVTLVLPASINTPFFNHARSRLGVKPRPVPPVYSPELAGDALVAAAERPQRVVYVGGSGLTFRVLEAISPALTDRLMLLRGMMFRQQESDQPDDGRDNLFRPIPEPGRVEGDFGHLVKPSLYTRGIELRPTWQRLLIPAALLGLVTLIRR